MIAGKRWKRATALGIRSSMPNISHNGQAWRAGVSHRLPKNLIAPSLAGQGAADDVNSAHQ